MDEEVRAAADDRAQVELSFMQTLLFVPPQVPGFSTPGSGPSWSSGSVSCAGGARGPAALHGLVRPDGGAGGAAHQEPAPQALRRHPPEDRHRLGERSSRLYFRSKASFHGDR